MTRKLLIVLPVAALLTVMVIYAAHHAPDTTSQPGTTKLDSVAQADRNEYINRVNTTTGKLGMVIDRAQSEGHDTKADYQAAVRDTRLLANELAAPDPPTDLIQANDDLTASITTSSTMWSIFARVRPRELSPAQVKQVNRLQRKSHDLFEKAMQEYSDAGVPMK